MAPDRPAKPKRRSLFDTLSDVEASAGDLTVQSDALAQAESVARSRARLPLAAIHDRPGGDTRPVAPAHAAALADSISAFGLIQPIVVDRHHRLLAGSHRRAALRLLQEQDAAAFARHFADGVPVHVYDLDAVTQAELALAVEIAENEKRRDYSRAEAIGMAERLKELGYSYRETAGAPRTGERMLIPALAAMIGKSEKTIRRYLHEALADPAAAAAVSENVDTVQILRRTRGVLERLRQGQHAPTEQEALRIVVGLITTILDK